MIISQPKIHTEQEVIWPWVGNKPIESAAATRVYCGEFFEEATRVLTGARRHTTDGTADVCPDLSNGDDYYEVKSLSTGSFYVFEHRLVNDRMLVDAAFQNRLTYVIWLHDAPATKCRTLFSLRASLAAHCSEALVIPFERLWTMTRRMKPCKLEYRPGQPYVRAYRIPISRLRMAAKGKSERIVRVGKVLGQEVGYVRLHGPDLGRLFPVTDIMRERAQLLLEDLSQHHLEVTLVDPNWSTHVGHKIRQTMDTNPRWYTDLCAKYPNKRKGKRNFRNGAPDTDIRRKFVLKSLERLSQGVCKYEYDWRLRYLVDYGKQ